MNEVFANAYGIGNAGRCALVWYPDVRLGSIVLKNSALRSAWLLD
jgi:hypothetical protein